MTDDDAVKVVADAMKQNSPWNAQDNEEYNEAAEVAVAALRKAGWSPASFGVRMTNAVIAKQQQLDEARSLLRDLEEVAKFVLDANPHMNYSGNLRQALAAVAQARKDGGFERLPR